MRRGQFPGPGQRSDAGRYAPGGFPGAHGGRGESRGGASGAGVSGTWHFRGGSLSPWAGGILTRALTQEEVSLRGGALFLLHRPLPGSILPGKRETDAV